MLNSKKLCSLFELAWQESKHSRCLKKKVGAVLYDASRDLIMGIGHGGAVTPCETCIRKTVEWKQDGCWSVHAEIRALFHFFERYGFSKNLSHAVMLTTHGPCDSCIKYCNYFNIPLIIYEVFYDNDYSKWNGKIKVGQKNEFIL